MTTIGEILEFAIERESQAAELYIAMAERVKDAATREFFENLVTAELEHKSRLELEMMKEGLVVRTVGVLPETSGDDTPLDPGQIAEHMTYAEALGLAIQKEKRSFRLYARLAGLIREEELGETLLSLAEEEAKHFVVLEEQYKKTMTGHQ